MPPRCGEKGIPGARPAILQLMTFPSADPVMRVLKDRKPHLQGRCRVCRWLDVCNGNLRVRAERYFGDFLAPDVAQGVVPGELVDVKLAQGVDTRHGDA